MSKPGRPPLTPPLRTFLPSLVLRRSGRRGRPRPASCGRCARRSTGPRWPMTTDPGGSRSGPRSLRSAVGPARGRYRRPSGRRSRTRPRRRAHDDRDSRASSGLVRHRCVEGGEETGIPTPWCCHRVSHASTDSVSVARRTRHDLFQVQPVPHRSSAPTAGTTGRGVMAADRARRVPSGQRNQAARGGEFIDDGAVTDDDLVRLSGSWPPRMTLRP